MKRPDFLYNIFLLDFVLTRVEGLNAIIQGTESDLTYVRLKTKAAIEVLQKFNTVEHANHMFDSVEMFLGKYNLDTMESKGLKRCVETPRYHRWVLYRRASPRTGLPWGRERAIISAHFKKGRGDVKYVRDACHRSG